MTELFDVLADPVGNLSLPDPPVEGVGDFLALEPSLPGHVGLIEKLFRTEAELATDFHNRVKPVVLIFPTLRQVEFLPKGSKLPRIESRLLP